WWAEQNSHHRHLWPGNYTGRYPAEELVEQIKVTRSQIAEPGNVHFSMKSILNNSGGKADALRAIYAEPALVPAMPWLGKKPEVKLGVEWKNADGRRQLAVKPEGDPVRLIVVRSK